MPTSLKRPVITGWRFPLPAADERRHAHKEPEYQRCREQERLLHLIGRSTGPSEAAVIFNEALGPQPKGVAGLSGSTGGGVFNMIGD